MDPIQTPEPQPRRPSVVPTVVFCSLLNAALWMLIIKLIYFSISPEVLAVIVFGIFSLSMLGLCMIQVAEPKSEAAIDTAPSRIATAAKLPDVQRASETAINS